MSAVQASFLPGSDAREDEDTIEIQLSPMQFGLLVRAAEEAERRSEAPPAKESLLPVLLPPKKPVEDAVILSPAPGLRGGRLYLAAGGGAILLALSVTIAYQLGARAHWAPAAPPPQPVVTAPADTRTPASPPPPVLEQTDERPAPVRFANPFDSSEVFEFPPGTSDAEARETVAALLIRRAHERQTPPQGQDGAKPQSDRPDPSLAQRT